MWKREGVLTELSPLSEPLLPLLAKKKEILERRRGIGSTGEGVTTEREKAVCSTGEGVTIPTRIPFCSWFSPCVTVLFQQ